MSDEPSQTPHVDGRDDNPVAVEPQYAPVPGKKYSKPKKSRKGLILAAIVVAVLLAAGAAYMLLKPKQAAAPATSPTTTSSGTKSAVPTDESSSDTATTKYTSPASALNLSFEYPNNWTVDPPSGTAGSSNDTSATAVGSTITVTSPRVSLTGADNATVTGRVIVKIRASSVGLAELNSKSAVAAQDSVQIGYTKPTAAQHQYPYLTFIHFNDGSKVDGAFEEVIVTGVNTFKKGSTLSTGTLGAVDPLITAQFVQCNTSDCTGTNAVPLAITNATWTNADVNKQALAIIESLQLN